MRRHIFPSCVPRSRKFPGHKSSQKLCPNSKVSLWWRRLFFFPQNPFCLSLKAWKFLFFRAKLEMLSSAKNPNLSDMIYATMQRFLTRVPRYDSKKRETHVLHSIFYARQPWNATPKYAIKLDRMLVSGLNFVSFFTLSDVHGFLNTILLENLMLKNENTISSNALKRL